MFCWIPGKSDRLLEHSNTLNQPPSVPPSQGEAFKPPLTRGGLEGFVCED